jgi:hypothetical protein
LITAHEINDRWERTKWTVYKSTWRNDVPMGFEYEIQTATRWKPKLPDIYKVDWELLAYSGYCDSVHGYEIKSPVAPLHYHKYLLRKHNFKDIKWCLDPKNKGGIHINISRSIRNGHKRRDKIAEFALQNKDDMCLLSGRPEELFNEYANVTIPSNHYYNFISTRKSEAFELRMFHAQPQLLLPALEFADSTFILASEDGAITMDNWIKFINRWPRYRSIAQHVRNTLCSKPTLQSKKGVMEAVSLSSESSSLQTQLIAA